MDKKFYLLGLCVAASAAFADAQQLPNVGFDDWKAGNDMGSTKYMGMTNATKPRPYDTNTGVTEPSGWNGSNVNQVFNFYFIEKETVAENNVAVRLVNKFAGIGTIGANAPGFITFGTPWVYAEMNTANCDGGAFGGMDFSYKPDAIKGVYKYAQGDAPETSHIIVYLWNGTFTSEIGSIDDTKKESCNDVDRAILGKSNAGTVTGDGKLVASCDYKITTTDGDWKEIIVPLAYVENAGEPTKMNVIISAADYWTRSNIQQNTTLSVDDVDFVYYSTLTELKVNGEAVALEGGEYEYAMSGTELPTAEQVAATTNSQFAKAAVTVDAANAQVRIDVTNQGGKDVDGETSHTYVLQYEKAVEAASYEGYLNILMGSQLAYNQSAAIEIADKEEGLCTFTLPDFNLGGMPFGDIVVDDVTVVEADGVKTYSGSVDGLTLAGGIVADVELSGTIDADNVCDFIINVTWNNLPIAVTFTTDLVGEDYAGYLNIETGGVPMGQEQQASVKIALTAVDKCTFLLPDFQFGGIPLGDIMVENVAITDGENGEKVYSGSTVEDLVLVPGAITASVEIDGTITADGHCNFKIDVLWKEQDTPIEVTFTTESLSGVEGIDGNAVAVYGMEGALAVSGYNGVVDVYAADGRLVKSVVADGDVKIALNGGLYIVRVGSDAYKVFVR